MLGLPAAATNVGNQSSPEIIPFSTLPAGTLPGQRIIAGARKPPSMTVPLLCANGVCPPSGHVKTSVPLSVLNTTMVYSRLYSTPCRSPISYLAPARTRTSFLSRPPSRSFWTSSS